MNLPNKLTLLRIIFVPFFMATYYLGRVNSYFYLVALAIFIIAAVTDFFDGRIAREYNMITNFGKIMDPLADKILVYAALAMMVAMHLVYSWMFVVILAREFLVSGIRAVASSQGKVIPAVFSGKLKTVTQMVAVGALIFYGFFADKTGSLGDFGELVYYFGEVVLWISVALTVYSGFEIAIKNRDVFRG